MKPFLPAIQVPRLASRLTFRSATLLVMLVGAMAIAGCDDRPSPIVPIGPSYPPHPGSLSVRDLARRLNMTITAASETVITMRNPLNSVVIYADPCGQAYVNGRAVGAMGGYAIVGNSMFAPEEIEPQIRNALRDPRIPPLVPPPPPPPPQSTVFGRVVIDPGHGGDDFGTIGAGKAHPEKDINLAVALCVADALRKRGVEVTCTRTTDRRVELDDRVAIANRSGANLFVAIHADFSENRANEGHTIITPRVGSGDASLAAGLISPRMTSAGSPLHGVRADVRRLRVLEAIRIPAVLVETGFLSNPREAARLCSAAYQQQLGQGIADGIADYLQKNRR
jgi:N-acetylmuramoyl-L-alanine amidase